MTIFKRIVFVVASFLLLQTTQAQTVDEIIAHYITALGGKEKLKKLNSVKIMGSLRKEGFVLNVTTTIQNGIGTRTDIAIPDLGEGYQITTRTQGWTFMPFNGQTKPQEMTEAQVKAGQVTIDLQGALFNYQQKGHRVELMGKETVDSLACYKLKLIHKTGKEIYYYIDTKHYYRIKLTTTEMLNNVPTEVSTVYSDFRRSPEGYIFPYTQTNLNGTLKVFDIKINQPIPKDTFKVKQ